MIIFKGIGSHRGIFSWPLTNRGLTFLQMTSAGWGCSMLPEAAGSQDSGGPGPGLLPCQGLQKMWESWWVLWPAPSLTNIVALVLFSKSYPSLLQNDLQGSCRDLSFRIEHWGRGATCHPRA